MWMTSPDEESPEVVRIAANNEKTGVPKAGSGPEVDPDYILLLQILDQHPEAKRHVIEALSKEK